MEEERRLHLRGDTGLHQDPLRPRGHERERRHAIDREGRKKVQVLHLTLLFLHGPEVVAHDGSEDTPQDHRDVLLEIQDFGDRNCAATEEDVWNLELPDVRTAGSLPVIMEMSKLSEKFGLPIVPSCGSAFTRAGNLCGMDKLLRWMTKKPDVVHHLLRQVTDHIIQVARHWVDTFGAGPLWAWSAESSGSNDLISGKHFETFALPYLVEVHESLLKMGIKTFHFHLSGKEKQNLPYASQVPLGDHSMVGIDHPTDLDEAIKVFGERAVIVGNVDTSVIHTGTPKQVYELAKGCIEKGKRAPRGFILSPGDEIPPDAPPFNVFMLRKAINDFGWYD